MKTLTILLLFIHQVLQNNGLVQLRSFPTSDNPLVMKILESVDAATSDEHLFHVTLKLLKSLCLCMRETLTYKDKEVDGDSSSIDDESASDEGIVLDIYKKIYNHTCFNLRHEVASDIHKQSNLSTEGDSFLDHTNCGKLERRTVKKTSPKISSEKTALKGILKSRFHNILYQALRQTKDHHTYRIRRYNLFGRAKPHIISNEKHSIIVILTLHPNISNYESNQKLSIEVRLNRTLYSNSSIEIDIIDGKYDSKGKESEEHPRPDAISDCNLQSLYVFLIESERNNHTKVFRILQKQGTIKVYIDVTTNRNHSDFSSICCKNYTDIPLCKNNLITHFKIEDGPSIVENDTLTYYKEENDQTSISEINNLFKLYTKRLIDENDWTHGEIIKNRGNEVSSRIYIYKDGTIPHTYVPQEPIKLREVTQALLLLNDVVTKQTTKMNLQVPQTDAIKLKGLFSKESWIDFIFNSDNLLNESSSTTNVLATLGFDNSSSVYSDTTTGTKSKRFNSDSKTLITNSNKTLKVYDSLRIIDALVLKKTTNRENSIRQNDNNNISENQSEKRPFTTEKEYNTFEYFDSPLSNNETTNNNKYNIINSTTTSHNAPAFSNYGIITYKMMQTTPTIEESHKIHPMRMDKDVNKNVKHKYNDIAIYSTQSTPLETAFVSYFKKPYPDLKQKILHFSKRDLNKTSVGSNIKALATDTNKIIMNNNKMDKDTDPINSKTLERTYTGNEYSINDREINNTDKLYALENFDTDKPFQYDRTTEESLSKNSIKWAAKKIPNSLNLVQTRNIKDQQTLQYDEKLPNIIDARHTLADEVTMAVESNKLVLQEMHNDNVPIFSILPTNMASTTISDINFGINNFTYGNMTYVVPANKTKSMSSYRTNTNILSKECDSDEYCSRRLYSLPTIDKLLQLVSPTPTLTQSKIQKLEKDIKPIKFKLKQTTLEKVENAKSMLHNYNEKITVTSELPVRNITNNNLNLIYNLGYNDIIHSKIPKNKYTTKSINEKGIAVPLITKIISIKLPLKEENNFSLINDPITINEKPNENGEPNNSIKSKDHNFSSDQTKKYFTEKYKSKDFSDKTHTITESIPFLIEDATKLVMETVLNRSPAILNKTKTSHAINLEVNIDNPSKILIPSELKDIIGLQFYADGNKYLTKGGSPTLPGDLNIEPNGLILNPFDTDSMTIQPSINTKNQALSKKYMSLTKINNKENIITMTTSNNFTSKMSKLMYKNNITEEYTPTEKKKDRKYGDKLEKTSNFKKIDLMSYPKDTTKKMNSKHAMLTKQSDLNTQFIKNVINKGPDYKVIYETRTSPMLSLQSNSKPQVTIKTIKSKRFTSDMRDPQNIVTNFVTNVIPDIKYLKPELNATSPVKTVLNPDNLIRETTTKSNVSKKFTENSILTAADILMKISLKGTSLNDDEEVIVKNKIKIGQQLMPISLNIKHNMIQDKTISVTKTSVINHIKSTRNNFKFNTDTISINEQNNKKNSFNNIDHTMEIDIENMSTKPNILYSLTTDRTDVWLKLNKTNTQDIVAYTKLTTMIFNDKTPPINTHGIDSQSLIRHSKKNRTLTFIVVENSTASAITGNNNKTIGTTKKVSNSKAIRRMNSAENYLNSTIVQKNFTKLQFNNQTNTNSPTQLSNNIITNSSIISKIFPNHLSGFTINGESHLKNKLFDPLNNNIQSKRLLLFPTTVKVNGMIINNDVNRTITTEVRTKNKDNDNSTLKLNKTKTTALEKKYMTSDQQNLIATYTNNGKYYITVSPTTGFSYHKASILSNAISERTNSAFTKTKNPTSVITYSTNIKNENKIQLSTNIIKQQESSTENQITTKGFAFTSVSTNYKANNKTVANTLSYNKTINVSNLDSYFKIAQNEIFNYTPYQDNETDNRTAFKGTVKHRFTEDMLKQYVTSKFVTIQPKSVTLFNQIARETFPTTSITRLKELASVLGKPESGTVEPLSNTHGTTKTSTVYQKRTTNLTKAENYSNQNSLTTSLYKEGVTQSAATIESFPILTLPDHEENIVLPFENHVNKQLSKISNIDKIKEKLISSNLKKYSHLNDVVRTQIQNSLIETSTTIQKNLEILKTLQTKPAIQTQTENTLLKTPNAHREILTHLDSNFRTTVGSIALDVPQKMGNINVHKEVTESTETIKNFKTNFHKNIYSTSYPFKNTDHQIHKGSELPSFLNKESRINEKTSDGRFTAYKLTSEDRYRTLLSSTATDENLEIYPQATLTAQNSEGPRYGFKTVNFHFDSDIEKEPDEKNKKNVMSTTATLTSKINRTSDQNTLYTVNIFSTDGNKLGVYTSPLMIESITKNTEMKPVSMVYDNLFPVINPPTLTSDFVKSATTIGSIYSVPTKHIIVFDKKPSDLNNIDNENRFSTIKVHLDSVTETTVKSIKSDFNVSISTLNKINITDFKTTTINNGKYSNIKSLRYVSQASAFKENGSRKLSINVTTFNPQINISTQNTLLPNNSITFTKPTVNDNIRIRYINKTTHTINNNLKTTKGNEIFNQTVIPQKFIQTVNRTFPTLSSKERITKTIVSIIQSTTPNTIIPNGVFSDNLTTKQREWANFLSPNISIKYTMKGNGLKSSRVINKNERNKNDTKTAHYDDETALIADKYKDVTHPNIMLRLTKPLSIKSYKESLYHEPSIPQYPTSENITTFNLVNITTENITINAERNSAATDEIFHKTALGRLTTPIIKKYLHAQPVTKYVKHAASVSLQKQGQTKIQEYATPKLDTTTELRKSETVIFSNITQNETINTIGIINPKENVSIAKYSISISLINTETPQFTNNMDKVTKLIYHQLVHSLQKPQAKKKPHLNNRKSKAKRKKKLAYKSKEKKKRTSLVNKLTTQKTRRVKNTFNTPNLTPPIRINLVHTTPNSQFTTLVITKYSVAKFLHPKNISELNFKSPTNKSVNHNITQNITFESTPHPLHENSQNEEKLHSTSWGINRVTKQPNKFTKNNNNSSEIQQFKTYAVLLSRNKTDNVDKDKSQKNMKNYTMMTLQDAIKVTNNINNDSNNLNGNLITQKVRLKNITAQYTSVTIPMTLNKPTNNKKGRDINVHNKLTWLSDNKQRTTKTTNNTKNVWTDPYMELSNNKITHHTNRLTAKTQSPIYNLLTKSLKNILMNTDKTNSLKNTRISSLSFNKYNTSADFTTQIYEIVDKITMLNRNSKTNYNEDDTKNTNFKTEFKHIENNITKYKDSEQKAFEKESTTVKLIMNKVTNTGRISIPTKSMKEKDVIDLKVTLPNYELQLIESSTASILKNKTVYPLIVKFTTTAKDVDILKHQDSELQYIDNKFQNRIREKNIVYPPFLIKEKPEVMTASESIESSNSIAEKEMLQRYEGIISEVHRKNKTNRKPKVTANAKVTELFPVLIEDTAIENENFPESQILAASMNIYENIITNIFTTQNMAPKNKQFLISKSSTLEFKNKSNIVTGQHKSFSSIGFKSLDNKPEVNTKTANSLNYTNDISLKDNDNNIRSISYPLFRNNSVYNVSFSNASYTGPNISFKKSIKLNSRETVSEIAKQTFTHDTKGDRSPKLIDMSIQKNLEAQNKTPIQHQLFHDDHNQTSYIQYDSTFKNKVKALVNSFLEHMKKNNLPLKNKGSVKSLFEHDITTADKTILPLLSDYRVLVQSRNTKPNTNESTLLKSKPKSKIYIKNIVKNKIYDGDTNANTTRLNKITETLKKGIATTTRVIKYNTYQPPTKEDLDLLYRYDSLTRTPFFNALLYKKVGQKPLIQQPIFNATACAILKNLIRKSNNKSIKDLNAMMKAANCSHEEQIYKLHTEPKNVHSNVMKKTIHKSFFSNSFENKDLYSNNLTPAKPRRKIMRRIKLANKRKEIMTMNTHDFFSQRRFITQKNVVKDIPKPRARPLIYKPVTSIPRYMILRPKFEYRNPVAESKSMANHDDDFSSDEVFAHHQTNILPTRKKISFIPPIPKPVMLVTPRINILERPFIYPRIKPVLLRDKIDSVRRGYIYNPVHTQTTQGFIPHQFLEEDRMLVEEDLPTRQYHKKEKHPHRIPPYVLTTPKHRRTLFFLSPTLPYNNYF